MKLENRVKKNYIKRNSEFQRRNLNFRLLKYIYIIRYIHIYLCWLCLIYFYSKGLLKGTCELWQLKASVIYSVCFSQFPWTGNTFNKTCKWFNKKNCRIWEVPIHIQCIPTKSLIGVVVIGSHFFENDFGQTIIFNAECLRSIMTNLLP